MLTATITYCTAQDVGHVTFTTNNSADCELPHTSVTYFYRTAYLACVVVIFVLVETAASLWCGYVMVMLYLILFIEQVLILASSLDSLGSNKHTQCCSKCSNLFTADTTDYAQQR